MPIPQSIKARITEVVDLWQKESELRMEADTKVIKIIEELGSIIDVSYDQGQKDGYAHWSKENKLHTTFQYPNGKKQTSLKREKTPQSLMDIRAMMF